MAWDGETNLQIIVRWSNRRIFLQSAKSVAARVKREYQCLLRRYIPKGTDLSVHSHAYLNKVARQQADGLGSGIMGVDEVARAGRKGFRGASLGHLHLAPGGMCVEEDRRSRQGSIRTARPL
jgi:hypothetical protein